MGIVLVVEDDDDLRKAICQVPADEGVATTSAANGAEALARGGRNDHDASDRCQRSTLRQRGHNEERYAVDRDTHVEHRRPDVEGHLQFDV